MKRTLEPLTSVQKKKTPTDPPPPPPKPEEYDENVYDVNDRKNHRHTGPLSEAVFDLLSDKFLRFAGFFDGVFRYQLFVANGKIKELLESYSAFFLTAILREQDLAPLAPTVWKGGKFASLFKTINVLNRNRDDADNPINDLTIFAHPNFQDYKNFLESGNTPFRRLYNRFNKLVHIGFEDPRVYKPVDGKLGGQSTEPLDSAHELAIKGTISPPELKEDMRKKDFSRWHSPLSGTFEMVDSIMSEQDFIKKTKAEPDFVRRILITDYVTDPEDVTRLFSFMKDSVENFLISQNGFMLLSMPIIAIEMVYIPEMRFPTNDGPFKKYKISNVQAAVYGIADKLSQIPSIEKHEIKSGLALMDTAIYVPRPIGANGFLVIKKNEDFIRLYLYASNDKPILSRADNMEGFVFMLKKTSFKHDYTFRVYLYYDSVVITDLVEFNGEHMDMDLVNLSQRCDFEKIKFKIDGITFRTYEKTDNQSPAFDLHVVELNGKRKRATSISKIYVENFVTWMADYIAKFGYKNFFQIYELNGNYDYIIKFIDAHSHETVAGERIIDSYDSMDLLAHNMGNHPVVVSVDNRYLPPLIINIEKNLKPPNFPKMEKVFSNTGSISKYYFMLKHQPSSVSEPAFFTRDMQDSYLRYKGGVKLNLPVSPYARFPNRLTDELYDGGKCDYAYYLNNMRNRYFYDFVVGPLIDEYHVYRGAKEATSVKANMVQFYEPEENSDDYLKQRDYDPVSPVAETLDTINE